MRFSFFDHRRVRQAMALALVIATLFCLFPPNQPLMVYWAGNSAFVALGCLVLGLFFFFMNRTHLMFVCMTCCAIICFYYLETSTLQSSKGYFSVQPDSLKMIHPLNNEYPKKN